jgi:hypothetical protein
MITMFGAGLEPEQRPSLAFANQEKKATAMRPSRRVVISRRIFIFSILRLGPHHERRKLPLSDYSKRI